MHLCMDWRGIKFDWNRARAFLITAEEGSYSAAARALGLTQPTIGRQVAALEAELGVTLFERVGHKLQLTEAGHDLVEQVRPMGEAAMRFSLAATGQSKTLAGRVRVSASEAIVAYLLPPAIEAVRLAHPAIELDIVATLATSDLRRREADIAVRNFRPTEPDFIARKLPERQGWMYATPGYLERVGPVETVADLSRVDFFGFDSREQMVKDMRRFGIDLEPRNFSMTVPNHLAQWELTKAGLGVCFMMEEVGDREPAVVRVLPGLSFEFPIPMWLVSHREVRTSRRLRAVFDALVDVLG